MEYFAGLEQMTLGDPTPAEIGGAQGVALQGSLTDTFIMSAPCDTNSWVFAGGTEMTLYVVDVGGEVVTIWVDEIPGVPQERVQGIIDSIVWQDLP